LNPSAFRLPAELALPLIPKPGAETGHAQEADMGILMLPHCIRGEAEIARFKAAGGLINRLHHRANEKVWTPSAKMLLSHFLGARPDFLHRYGQRSR
jgi:hypothetical protein